MTSYVEAEEPLDDPDDTVPVRVLGADGNGVQDFERDPLDLAAHAIRALTGLPNNENPAPDASTSTPLPSGKRRGRPPRQSLGSIGTPSPAAKDSKRRGRPPGPRRKSLLESVENNEDTAMPDAPDAADAAEAAEAAEAADAANAGEMDVDDATAAQLDGAVSDKNAPASEQAPTATGTGRKRGRPPGRRMTLPASTEDDRVETIPTPSSSLPPRRRGRPPAAATAARKQAEAEESPEPALPPSGSLLSLAERMALKGKKVKVRARASRDSAGVPTTGSPATATPAGTRSGAGTPAASKSATGTPAPANARGVAMPDVETGAEPAAADDAVPKRGRGELEDKEFAPAPEGDDSDGSESDAAPEPEPDRGPASSVKKRPTVVRLDFSSESEDTGSMVSDVSDDDAADESSEPKRRFTAVRGRGRGRGRGRPRGGRGGGLRGRA
ncbi:hypothetical protein DL770_010644 [Monosporascus sp. CRB-9-2]|nr:hypothetical protein DL770_010644 [Monosporascus sp. CRB-9-2]